MNAHARATIETGQVCVRDCTPGCNGIHASHTALFDHELMSMGERRGSRASLAWVWGGGGAQPCAG